MDLDPQADEPELVIPAWIKGGFFENEQGFIKVSGFFWRGLCLVGLMGEIEEEFV